MLGHDVSLSHPSRAFGVRASVGRGRVCALCLRVCTLSSLTRPLAPTRPQLQSNAAIFKVESAYGFQQWYYERLQPWVHYVPVAADLSDLRER